MRRRAPRRWLPLLSLVLLSALPMQAAPGEDPVVEAQKAITTLSASFEGAQSAMRARLESLRETAEYKEAYEERDFAKLREMSGKISDPFVAEWKEKFSTIARSYAGQEAELVVAAAQMKYRLLDKPAQELERLIGAYPTSPQLAELIEGSRPPRGMQPDRFRELMTKIIDENPSKEIRAQAYFNRGNALRRKRDATDEEKASFEADFSKVIELLPADALLSLKAQGPRFEELRLQVGMKAPDIVGVDLFGESFKLSDYAGKVVMLDFWGDW